MNKYLLMSAAALLAGTGAAHAKGGTIDLGKGCGLMLTESQKGMYAVVYDGCGGSGTNNGQGIARKTDTGKRVELSDNIYAVNYGISSMAISFDISLPLKKGGDWVAYVEYSGTTSFEVNSGTYKPGKPAKARGTFMTQTNALIAQLRAERLKR